MTERMRQVLDALARLEAAGKDPATPSEIAWEAGFRDGPRRLGRGGGGGWTGYMSPAQHVIFPLTALRKRGLVGLMGRRDGRSGTAYYLTDAGELARESQEYDVVGEPLSLLSPPPPAPELAAFLQRLATARIGETCNQYREWVDGLDVDAGAPARRVANLTEHLTARVGRCDLLLVGEAPGYLRCRFTGIAFTSERQLDPARRTSTHQPGWAEPSATIVANTLTSLGIDASTVRWNAVPTHPHRPGEPRSNRAPTSEEVEHGRTLLDELIAVIEPREIVAVGRVAGRLLPDAPCVRHPARGGATRFRQGLADLVPERSPHAPS